MKKDYTPEDAEKVVGLKKKVDGILAKNEESFSRIKNTRADYRDMSTLFVVKNIKEVIFAKQLKDEGFFPNDIYLVNLLEEKLQNPSSFNFLASITSFMFFTTKRVGTSL